MTASADVLPEMEPLLRWLRDEPNVDAERELQAALRHCHALAEMALPPERRLALVDQFHGRVFDLAGRYRVRLMGASLPLSRDLHLPLRRLVELCLELVKAYLGLARELSGDLTRSRRLGDDSLGAHAMNLVTEAWVVGAMGGMAGPYDLWGSAHGVFLALGGPDPEAGLLAAGRDDRTIRAYKRLLALAVIQPESFSAREVGWASDFLGEFAGEVGLQGLPEGCASGYWIDPAQDMPPVAVSRRAPPPVDGLLHLATEPLARLVTERLGRLEEGAEEILGDPLEAVVAVTVQADLPEGLAARELAALLRRLRELWAMPPLRELPRRRSHHGVEVCIGLRTIWELRQNGEEAVELGDWLVLNESPGGCSLMSVGGVNAALQTGMAVALRRSAEKKWTICVVRWIRTENPSQVELGVEIVAEGATPVRVGFRGGAVREMVHGLLLPPLGQVRRHQAIMAPAGTYSSRRFVFVHEARRLYVAQGRLLSLDVQTASVELFQFEFDPYPL